LWYRQYSQDIFPVSHLAKLIISLIILSLKHQNLLGGLDALLEAYAAELLEKTVMANCNQCAVPLEARVKLSKEGDSPLVDPTKYRSLIGSLRYLLHIRPELTFSVSYLSRFMKKP
jgi:hypothetical protein